MSWNTRQRSLCVVALLAIVISTAWLVGFDHPVVADAAGYDAIGWNLAQGHGFSLAEAPPYTPTMFREPLYPAFLALLYRAFGHRPDLVPYGQILLFVGTCWLIFVLGAWLFDPRVGWWTGVATACFPALANYPSYLLTETLFTFLLTGSLGAVCLAWHRRDISWWAAAGALLGLTALCKAVAAPFVIICALSLVLMRSAGYAVRHRISHALILLAVSGVVVGPWIARNQRVFGSAQLSLRGEVALWMRASKLDDSPRQVLQAAVYNVSEYVGSVLFPEAGVMPRDVILEGSHRAFQLQGALMAQGLSELQANRRLGQEAWALIRQYPFRYVFYAPIEALKLTAFSYVPSLNEQAVIEWFSQHPHGRLVLAMLRGAVRLLAYPLLGLAGYGFWMARHRWRDWWPFGWALLYINGIHALLFSIGRFAIPLVPVYLLFAAVGMAAWRRTVTAPATVQMKPIR